MKLPAFFFDIDGTLLDYPHQLNQISPETRAALDTLRLTHPVFIASGRTKCFIDQAILDYPFDGFVTCNGAYVEYQQQCVGKTKMAFEALQKAMAVARQLHAILYLESRDEIYVVNAHLPQHQIFVEKWAMRPETIVTCFDPARIEVYIGMMVAQNEADCLQIQRLLQDDFEVSQHVNQLSFDLTLKGQSKATGISQVMDYFGASLKDAWAFGDGNNDIEMIQAVGHGIAMGNAVAALKAVAFDVTDDACQNGIVTCLKKYHWIE